MASYVRIVIASLLIQLGLSACGGGSGESENSGSPSALRTPTPSPVPEPEMFSLEIEPTVVNESLGDLHLNRLDISGRVTGDDAIGFVRIVVLDGLDIFSDEVVAEQSLEQNFFSIRLEPRDDLRRGTYEGSLALTFCTTPSCTELLGESPYLIDYIINYIPQYWTFEIQDHPHLITQDEGSQFTNEKIVEFISADGEVLEPVQVLVDWPQNYSGFTLPQDMLEELQVFDIREDGFSFRLVNSSVGSYKKEYTITLHSDDDPRNELSFTLGHAVVPQGFDGTRAQLLTEQLEFNIGSEFDAPTPAQFVRVYRPLRGDVFDSIGFLAHDCSWLDIESHLFDDTLGFYDVRVSVREMFIADRNQACEVDVRYADESIGTLTVRVFSQIE